VVDVVDDVELFEFRREAPSLAERAAEVIVRGAAGVVASEVTGGGGTLGDGVRPMMGGVEILGVAGADDLGVAGLDQELKKSSSVSSFGAGVGEVSIPSMAIPLGNLCGDKSTNTRSHT